MVARVFAHAWILAVALVGGTSVLARQAPPPSPLISQPTVGSPLLVQIIQDLGSDDIVLRTNAQARLVESETFKLHDVEGVLKEGKIGPEQRLRLMAVASKRFRIEPRAALGVQSAMGDAGQRGVVLDKIMPGFPSSETLRPGDRVLVVDGQAITDISLMRPVVIAHDPGDEVPVSVLREGATLNLKVKLGRFTDLGPRGGAGSMTTELLDEAWEFRSATYSRMDPNGEPEPIESGLAAADWKIVGQPDVDDGADSRMWNNDRVRVADADVKDCGLVAAGEVRGLGVILRLPGQAGVNRDFRLVPGGDGALVIGPNVQFPDAIGGKQGDPARQAQLVMIRQAQDRYRKLIERNNALARSAPESKRRAMIQENALFQLQIEELERLAQQQVQQPQVPKR